MTFCTDRLGKKLSLRCGPEEKGCHCIHLLLHIEAASAHQSDASFCASFGLNEKAQVDYF